MYEAGETFTFSTAEGSNKSDRYQRKKAAEAEGKIYGEENKDTLNQQYFLLCLHVDNRKYATGIEIGKELLAHYKKLLGVNHQYSIDTLLKLVKCYEETGNLTEKIRTVSILYEIYCQNMGADSQQALDMLLNIALTDYSMKNYDNAIEKAEKVLAVYYEKIKQQPNIILKRNADFVLLFIKKAKDTKKQANK